MTGVIMSAEEQQGTDEEQTPQPNAPQEETHEVHHEEHHEEHREVKPAEEPAEDEGEQEA